MPRCFIKPELKKLSAKNPWHILAVGFGSGLSPVMPGTMGSLAAIPFYLLLSQLSLTGYLLLICAGFLLGIFICQQATNAIGMEDHGAIVWDEFIGFFITMIAAPVGIVWLVLGFCLFRLFDILKPPPIKWIDQHCKGGFGIMLDDVIAGGMALITLQAIAFMWHTYF